MSWSLGMIWNGRGYDGVVESRLSEGLGMLCVLQCLYITSSCSVSRGCKCVSVTQICSFSVRLWAVTESGSWWRAPWQPGTGWACRTLSCWRTTPARWRSSRTLRKRFKENLIYVRAVVPVLFTLKAEIPEYWCDPSVFISLPQTYIGSVLVSVNPYKELEIYTKQHMERYRGVNFYEVSPHM